MRHSRNVRPLMVVIPVAFVFLMFLPGAIAPAAARHQPTGQRGSPDAPTTVDSRSLPPPPQKFSGEIGLNALDSKIGWPSRVVPPKGGADILLSPTATGGFGAPS